MAKMLIPSNVSTITPIKDDTPASSRGMDEAGAGAFNLTRLMALVSDCEDQPNWRERADLAAAYVDGKQFTPEQMDTARKEGLGEVRPTNLIGRVIRSVCGTEAKTRTDVKIESDDDDIEDVSDVLNLRMKEAQRETYADMAVSNAYFGQATTGIGWVEVARNADPLDYPYRVKDIHRSEMWWDWKDPDLVLRGARWVARKRWGDLDELEAAMPRFKELFRMMANGWSGFMWDNTLDETMIQQYDADQRYRNYRGRAEWIDGARKRVKLYEIWYKIPADALVISFSPTRRMLLDQRNPAHMLAISQGRAMVSRSITRQVRMALFAGPHRLVDIGTKRRNFPYVPFFAYRDDADQSPYGLVEGMIGPQDGYNKRRLRIEWMLKARQIQVDNDALDTKANSLAEIADAVMRPDLTIVLDANRKNRDGIKIGADLQLQKEQIDVMQDDKQLIQDVPGVYGSQLGQAASGVTSGIANSLLIEQGAVAMGDLNDNYRHSRRMVFENLLDLIVEDWSMPNMQAKIGRGSSRRVVTLNTIDPQTGDMVNNVADAPMRVGLGDVPNTPSYRMQQQQNIATIVQALAQASPQAAAVLAPSFIEQTDLPDRMERADDVRHALGLPTSGDRAQQKQQQAVAEQQAQEKAAMDKQAAMQQLEAQAANIEKTRSDTELNKAKVIQLGHGMATDSIATADSGLQGHAQTAVAAQQANALAAQQAADEADRSIIDAQNKMIADALNEAKARGVAPAPAPVFAQA